MRQSWLPSRKSSVRLSLSSSSPDLEPHTTRMLDMQGSPARRFSPRAGRGLFLDENYESSADIGCLPLDVAAVEPALGPHDSG